MGPDASVSLDVNHLSSSLFVSLRLSSALFGSLHLIVPSLFVSLRLSIFHADAAQSMVFGRKLTEKTFLVDNQKFVQSAESDASRFIWDSQAPGITA